MAYCRCGRPLLPDSDVCLECMYPASECPCAPSTRPDLDQLPPAQPADEANDLDQRRDALAELELDESNQATALVGIARAHFEMFTSPDGRAWAVEIGGPNVAIPIGRRGRFGKVLARRYIEATGKAPGDTALAGAERILTAFLDDDDPRPVFLRYGQHKETIVIDLGTPDGSCVIVSADSWHVEARSPVPFRRGKAAPLPTPKRDDGTGLDQLAALLNVNDDGFRLAVGCLICYMIPGIPYPVMLVRGEQGTAKSTFCNLMVRAIDPGRDAGKLPRDERAFGVRMWNGHVHAFDNLGELPDWQSDMICRASTGDDSGERALYSDDELLSMPYLRALLLNGIDFGAMRPDLADRAVPITLTKIPERQRRPLRRAVGGKRPGILDLFDEAHPAIFGALLDMLSDVLRHLPHVRPVLPRMADFGNVLAAIDRSHDAKNGRRHPRPLLPLYKSLWQNAIAESGRDDDIAGMVLKLMDANRDGWKGTTAELLSNLTGLLDNPERPPRRWPQRAEALGHRIPRINPGLRANGWEIIKDGHSRNGAVYSIEPYATPAAADDGGPLADDPSDLGEYDETSTSDPETSEDNDLAKNRTVTATVTQTVTVETAGQTMRGDGCDGVTVLPQNNPHGGISQTQTVTTGAVCEGCGGPLDSGLTDIGFTTHGGECDDLRDAKNGAQ